MRVARLGDVVASMKNGIYKPSSEYADDGVPCLRMYNIEAGAIAWRDIKRMRLTTQEQEDYGLCEGDLLVNRVNSRELVGKSAYVPASIEPSVFESKNIRVRLARDRAEPKFINYQLLARGSRHFANNAQQVVGMASISQGQLADFPIVLAELDEQRRIVAEIEKQFSRLDEAVANLQRVKANLLRFQSAVLSSAVDGSLTEPRGRTGQDSPLVPRLLAAHRSAWKKDGKYIPPPLVAPDDLPKLPTGWDWAPLGLLGKDPFNTVQTGPFGAQLHNTDFRESGVPVIAVGNLTGTGFRRDNLYFIDAAKASQLSRYDVWAGDLLFARSGATLGKVCVAPADVADWRMTGHILRARLNTDFILPDVAVYALAAMPAVRKQVFGNVRGVTRPGFNTSLLESIWLPVPPIDEQHRIVAEVDRRLSIVRGVEAEVDANLKRAQALRQAILARAFST